MEPDLFTNIQSSRPETAPRGISARWTTDNTLFVGYKKMTYEPLLKILSQKVFVSVEVDRNEDIIHKLIVQNQSEFTVELLRIEVNPPYPIGFGASGSISDTKILQNKQLIPGQKIEFQIDKKSNKNISQEYKFTAIYKTYLFGKLPKQKEQKSNTYAYCARNYTVPLIAVLEQKY